MDKKLFAAGNLLTGIVADQYKIMAKCTDDSFTYRDRIKIHFNDHRPDREKTNLQRQNNLYTLNFSPSPDSLLIPTIIYTERKF